MYCHHFIFAASEIMSKKISMGGESCGAPSAKHPNAAEIEFDSMNQNQSLVIFLYYLKYESFIFYFIRSYYYTKQPNF